jgi:hypothetical protein
MSYQPRQGTIYFIRREDGEGPVKIGFSSKPWVRLESIDVCSPHPLTIAAAIEGPSRLELRFHNLFRDSHIRREWFRGHAGAPGGDGAGQRRHIRRRDTPGALRADLLASPEAALV